MRNEWVLWGFKPFVVNEPIKLADGGKTHVASRQKYYEGSGWFTAVYAKGTEPEGFRLMMEADDA